MFDGRVSKPHCYRIWRGKGLISKTEYVITLSVQYLNEQRTD